MNVKQYIVTLVDGDTRAVNTNSLFSAQVIAEAIWGKRVREVKER